MPNYYNPYNFYPVSYANQMGYNNMPMAQPTMAAQQTMVPQQLKAMEWVEGEVGAKAFQMPQGWPANQPIPLWDSTDTIIWLKSWGPMGIPNPMQKLHYTMPEQQNQALLTNGTSGAGAVEPQQADMSHFATKDDIDSLRDEIRQMRQQSHQQNRNVSGNAGGNNQNGSNNGNVNRGGNG